MIDNNFFKVLVPTGRDSTGFLTDFFEVETPRGSSARKDGRGSSQARRKKGKLDRGQGWEARKETRMVGAQEKTRMVRARQKWLKTRMTEGKTRMAQDKNGSRQGWLKTKMGEDKDGSKGWLKTNMSKRQGW